MQWINGYSYDEKIRRKENWHKWFAWRPVIIGYTKENRRIKVWWEWIESKGTYHESWDEAYWTFEYRKNNEYKKI